MFYRIWTPDEFTPHLFDEMVWFEHPTDLDDVHLVFNEFTQNLTDSLEEAGFTIKNELWIQRKDEPLDLTRLYIEVHDNSEMTPEVSEKDYVLIIEPATT